MYNGPTRQPFCPWSFMHTKGPQLLHDGVFLGTKKDRIGKKVFFNVSSNNIFYASLLLEFVNFEWADEFITIAYTLICFDDMNTEHYSKEEN